MHKILGFTAVALHSFVDRKGNRPLSLFPPAPAHCNLLLVFNVLVLSVICWRLMARNTRGTIVLVRQVPSSTPGFPWLSPVSVGGSGCFALFLHWMKTLKELGYCHHGSVHSDDFYFVGRERNFSLCFTTYKRCWGYLNTFLPALHWKQMIEPVSLICVT